jgi:DNA-binding transcriptional MerR regulator
MSHYLISALAKKTGLTTDTIRFYEKKGFIQPNFRANNQYRYYGDDSLKKLMFIKHCRALEMSLKEIRSLLELEQSPQQNCSVVNEMIDQNIENINNRINDLNNFKQHLIQLRNSCNAPTTVDHCQILKQLESTDI